MLSYCLWWLHTYSESIEASVFQLVETIIFELFYDSNLVLQAPKRKMYENQLAAVLLPY